MERERYPFRVDYGGQVLTGHFRAHPENGLEVALRMRAAGRLLGMVVFVAAMVTDWDLTGEDGKPVPLTEEGLEPVPFVVLREVQSAIYRRLQEEGFIPTVN
jgi:hypothetical protein